jgi:NIMA (never in mitosis gene a)-related kinase 1/4/5
LHLTDFGISKNISDKERVESDLTSFKGTREYLSPEIHNAKKEKPNMTKQDVWAIGIIAYELCTFDLPFKGETSSAEILAIINDPLAPIEQDYSQELKDLISSMLNKNPEQRPSLNEVA